MNMKNIIKLLTISLSLLVFMGCEEEFERITFDGDGTFLSFAASNPSSVPVNVGESATVAMTISTSTLSDAARTYTLVIDTDATTANTSNFTLPASVTIPAGSYFGEFDLVVTDDDNLDSTSKNIVFSLGGVDNVSMDSNVASVSIFEVCPVPETFFTGMYLIEEITPLVDGPTLSDGSIVEVTLNEDDSSGLGRVFQTEYYPDYCSGTFAPFVVNLVCNEILSISQDNLCNCGDGAGWFGPLAPGSNSTYSLTDGDDVIEVTFLNDINANCAPVETTTYRFTKQ